MSNVEKLNISDADKDLLKKSAVNQMRFLGLEYSILACDEQSVTLLVRQKRLVNDKILSKQELLERAKEYMTVESLPQDTAIHIRPIVYNVSESEIVDSQWIQKKMAQYNLKLKNLVEMIGIDKSTLSVIVSGNNDLTKWHKATFYYFFKSLEKG